MTDPEDATKLFELAREHLLPLMTGHGLRLGALEYESGNAYAEYWRAGLRLRLVWEGGEQALWVDAAPGTAAQVIGRWQDIEWQLAGERQPLDHDVTEARVVRLVEVVGRYLKGRSEQ